MTWKKNMVYLCDYSDDNLFELLDGTQSFLPIAFL